MNKLFKEIYKNAFRSHNISFLRNIIFIIPNNGLKFYAKLSTGWYWYEDEDLEDVSSYLWYKNTTGLF